MNVLISRPMRSVMRLTTGLTSRPVIGFCTEHVGEFSKVSMPSVMDSAEGAVDSWLKKEGEVVLQGDTLCEVTLADLTIGIDAPAEGWLTILVPEGVSVGTGKLLAVVAATQEEYAIVSASDLEYAAPAPAAAAGGAVAGTTESSAETAAAAAAAAAAGEAPAYEEFKIDEAAIILRAVKHMLHTGELDENGDFAKALQRLIRKKDRCIFATFEASFEGEWVDFDVESNFDTKFFLAGAEDIIEEYAEEKAAAADKE